MVERSVQHGTFVVERSYPASPARVFRAWADPKQKSKWFGSGEENPTSVYDFTVGGREASEGKGPNGGIYSFEVIYRDIVPDNRIIYTYEMSLNGQRISVSVAAVELFAEGAGTKMKVTEHGAFLDGLDTYQEREAGTNWLMDQLGVFLSKQ